MYCPTCESEYREGFLRCNQCEADLVERLPEQQQGEPDVALVKVYECGNAALIPLLESVLDNAGIEYMTKGQPIQNLFGWGSFGSNQNFAIGPVEFYVREEFAEEARAVLETFATPDADSQAPVTGDQ
ncbi:MAG TPA: DUF2007 domain-containing protein [Thermoanaerobaculia bacterium]|jgi:hypothetical protein